MQTKASKLWAVMTGGPDDLESAALFSDKGSAHEYAAAFFPDAPIRRVAISLVNWDAA